MPAKKPQQKIAEVIPPQPKSKGLVQESRQKLLLAQRPQQSAAV